MKLKKKNSDKLKEECGVFGILNNKDAAALTALGLHSLQHRGQEGCGIVSSDGKNFYAERRLGLVGDNFTKGKVLENLPSLQENIIVVFQTTHRCRTSCEYCLFVINWHGDKKIRHI